MQTSAEVIIFKPFGVSKAVESGNVPELSKTYPKLKSECLIDGSHTQNAGFYFDLRISITVRGNAASTLEIKKK